MSLFKYDEIQSQSTIKSSYKIDLQNVCIAFVYCWNELDSFLKNRNPVGNQPPMWDPYMTGNGAEPFVLTWLTLKTAFSIIRCTSSFTDLQGDPYITTCKESHDLRLWKTHFGESSLGRYVSKIFEFLG